MDSATAFAQSPLIDLPSIDSPMIAAGIQFHVLDFSGMPESSVIKPGWYYTFTDPGAADGDDEPGVFLNGPRATAEDANNAALAFLADALTSSQGDEPLEVADEEVAFVEEGETPFAPEDETPVDDRLANAPEAV